MKMAKEKILITGATGNVGRALLAHIDTRRFEVIAGVRDVQKAQKQLGRTDIGYLALDLETGTGFDQLAGFGGLFLLRPPQISNVSRHVEPLLERIAKAGIRKLVFLSVQGAESRGYIPHRKIEKAIQRLGLPHVFLRPSYFMDNLTTTLSEELRRNRRIYLPAGKARFNWIDVDDIGRAAARVFADYETLPRNAYTLTNSCNLGFGEIVARINSLFGLSIRYVSPGLPGFVKTMRRTGHAWGYIGVLLLLHFLPRFEKEPPITTDLSELTGRPPRSIEEFLRANAGFFRKL